MAAAHEEDHNSPMSIGVDNCSTAEKRFLEHQPPAKGQERWATMSGQPVRRRLFPTETNTTEMLDALHAETKKLEQKFLQSQLALTVHQKMKLQGGRSRGHNLLNAAKESFSGTQRRILH
ncbi:hypothetical protein PROFUN_08684 [Planoprotostelium fungivorum]|uniref:Uncharacterized protein n=1 Tax=Planoprotostelium fungivorum TaxID=1890364 RepID=A0A2P6MQT8_9EUKA|nr:hypothetical protein PROFUN_08684 [Planoprotostelium fungivorum]